MYESVFDGADDSVNIFLGNVTCAGNEERLEHCKYSSVHTCVHSEDAGVICDTGVIIIINYYTS